MKTKFTLLTFLLLFTATFNYAQTSAEINGIAIQGIARDLNNTAKTNTNITLIFKLYYINTSNAEIVIGSEVNVQLTTDNFGVFSYVLEPGVTNNALMANHQVYLRISDAANPSPAISDEKLKHVPYAIAANNGVPTGSIMPFVGATAPTGWVLCNGQSIAGANGAENLIALIGNTAPDLRGMFLRGAGSNAVSGYTANSGPALNVRQQDNNLAHNHSASGLVTSNPGNHFHSVPHSRGDIPVAGINYQSAVNRSTLNGPFQAGLNTLGSGNHVHTITGNVSTEGAESRPVNYGVNYIIKL